MLSPVRSALVDCTDTFQHYAIHRDSPAGADDEDVALLHLLNRDDHFRAVPHQRGGFGGQLHQALESVRGFTLGVRLKHLADGDECEDHGGRLKIELHHIVHDEFVIAIDLSTGHGEEGVSAPHEACHGAEGHQRVHVGCAVDEALEAVEEELLVDDHDDPGQQQLDKTHGDVVAVEPVGEGPAPHHVAHGEVHQNQQEAQRGDEAALELRRLMVGQCVQIGAGAVGSVAGRTP